MVDQKVINEAGKLGHHAHIQPTGTFKARGLNFWWVQYLINNIDINDLIYLNLQTTHSISLNTPSPHFKQYAN